MIFDTAALTAKISSVGPQGPQGPKGDKGDQGDPATIYGVAAGGALTGTYPNPSLANAAVGPENLDTLPGVRLKKTSQQTIPDSALTEVEFNQETYDNMGFFPGSGSVVTIPLSGTYLITAGISYADGATGIRLLSIQANDTTTLASSLVPPGSLNGSQLNVATVARLNTGDIIKVKTNQKSGGSLNTFPIGFGHAYLTLQWIAR